MLSEAKHLKTDFKCLLRFFAMLRMTMNRSPLTTMRNGKKICERLKVVRKQIADANDIPYEITECPHQGPCAGTCPKCESELRYIENQLTLRLAAGKAVSLVGLSLGISSAFMASGCTPTTKTNANTETPTSVVESTETPPSITVNKIENEEYISEGAIELEESPVSGMVGKYTTEETDLNGETYYVIVDEMPEFPGGDIALINYIKQNLRYPAFAHEMGIQGRVAMSFIIESDGSISNIDVSRSPAEELSQEAIRLVKSMPKWTPGKKKGTPVRVKYLLPITFRIKE